MTSPRPVPAWLQDDASGSGWKGERAAELVQRQAHINQKLHQLREMLTILCEMQETVPQLREWLQGLQHSTRGSSFNPEIFVRMGAVAVWLRSRLAQLAAAGTATAAPAIGGAGLMSTTSPVDGLGSDAAAQAASAYRIMDAASGLGGTTPDEWVYQFGFERSDFDKSLPSFVGGELWSLVTSPFETYHRHVFTHEAMDQQEEFLAEHGDDLDAMSQAMRDALGALGSINNAIGGAHVDRDSSALGGGVEELESVLDDYANVYDRATGRGVPASGAPVGSVDDWVRTMGGDVSPVDGLGGDLEPWDQPWPFEADGRSADGW